MQIWVFIVAREAFCAVALIPLPGRKGWLPQQIVPVSLQVRLEAHHSATEGVKQDEPRQKVVNVLYLWPLHTGDRIHCRWQIHMYILVLSSRSPGLPLWGCRVWQCLCGYCGSSWGCFATERVQPCSSPPCAWWLFWGWLHQCQQKPRDGKAHPDVGSCLESPWCVEILCKVAERPLYSWLCKYQHMDPELYKMNEGRCL